MPDKQQFIFTLIVAFNKAAGQTIYSINEKLTIGEYVA